MPLNPVGIFFPNNMNQIEKNRSFEVITDLLPETSFHFSLYQAPEKDILEYIIQAPEKYFSHFHIHLLTTRYHCSEVVRDALNFIESLGAKIVEHNLPVNEEGLSSRKTFETFSSHVLRDTTELLVFYNNDPKQIAKLLLPISVAEAEGKTPYICKNHLNKDVIAFERQLI